MDAFKIICAMEASVNQISNVNVKILFLNLKPLRKAQCFHDCVTREYI